MSLRDRILAANDIGTLPMHVEAWDVDIEIRTMTAGARSRLLLQATDENDRMDLNVLYPLVLIATVYDPETGEPVFTSEDIEALQGKAADAIEQVATAAMKHSGMEPKATDVEGKDS